MCDVRMKGKKALENYHNDGRYCRTCSQLCELDVHYLVPESVVKNMRNQPRVIQDRICMRCIWICELNPYYLSEYFPR
jgi:hypothetical protein